MNTIEKQTSAPSNENIDQFSLPTHDNEGNTVLSAGGVIGEGSSYPPEQPDLAPAHQVEVDDGRYVITQEGVTDTQHEQSAADSLSEPAVVAPPQEFAPPIVSTPEKAASFSEKVSRFGRNVLNVFRQKDRNIQNDSKEPFVDPETTQVIPREVINGLDNRDQAPRDPSTPVETQVVDRGVITQSPDQAPDRDPAPEQDTDNKQPQ